MLPLLLLPSRLSSAVTFLLFSPFPLPLFSTPCPPTSILRGCLRSYIPFPHLLELPCVGSCKYLDFTCSPSPQASGAKANVWLKSWAGSGVVSANRLHHGLRVTGCLIGACQQHLRHLCPPQSTMPPLLFLMSHGEGRFLPSSLGTGRGASFSSFSLDFHRAPFINCLIKSYFVQILLPMFF